MPPPPDTRFTRWTALVRIVMLAGILAGGCQQGGRDEAHRAVDVPRGFVQRLEIRTPKGIVGFGPFVGYYFAPIDPADLSRLRFICFNERQFYTRDLPANAKLYRGEARLTELPEAGVAIPKAPPRIRPIFFKDAPPAWKATRPFPEDQYRHFHSTYNATGALRTGYWLRHNALQSFVYDMGGRVTPDSPLYHRVAPGPDVTFPAIIEFDNGPV